jgi:hypothetical protein
MGNTMLFFCYFGSEEFKDSDLFSFNKVAIYGDKKPDSIRIVFGDSVLVADYLSGELIVDNKVVYNVDKELVNLLRPINFMRNTFEIVIGKTYRFNGLGFQYTDFKNHKCFIKFGEGTKPELVKE